MLVTTDMAALVVVPNLRTRLPCH